VDTKVIPLHSRVYIPAFVGQAMPTGGVHDGCFRAEDRGMKITGNQLDIFAGSEAWLKQLNAIIPTASGVEVFIDEPRCGGASK
jgi:3D (Asp-Asp-Asp) domain-containing protein